MHASFMVVPLLVCSLLLYKMQTSPLKTLLNTDTHTHIHKIKWQKQCRIHSRWTKEMTQNWCLSHCPWTVVMAAIATLKIPTIRYVQPYLCLQRREKIINKIIYPYTSYTYSISLFIEKEIKKIMIFSDQFWYNLWSCFCNCNFQLILWSTWRYIAIQSLESLLIKKEKRKKKV